MSSSERDHIVYVSKDSHILDVINKLNPEDKNIHLPTIKEIEQNKKFSSSQLRAIIINFSEWSIELISLLNRSALNFETKVILLFESKDELDLHFSRLNRWSCYPLVKNNLVREQVKLILTEEKEDDFFTLRNIKLNSIIRVPAYIKAISEDEIIIERPSFSQEIEQHPFALRFQSLNLFIKSKVGQTTFSDNSIHIKGNFFDTMRMTKSIGCESVKFIKIAIFVTEDIASEHLNTLYSIPNSSCSVFINPEEINNKDFDLIFILDHCCQDYIFSRKILDQLELHKQHVCILNGFSSTKAYQKAYNYDKILSTSQGFDVELIKNIILKLQNKQDSKFYYFDQTETINEGIFLVDVQIISLNEREFQFKVPFKIEKSSTLQCSFFCTLMAHINEVIKENEFYTHYLIFTNICDLEESALRRFLNTAVKMQMNGDSLELIKNFKEILGLEQEAV